MLSKFYKVPDDSFNIICKYCEEIIDIRYSYKEDNEQDIYSICEDCSEKMQILGELD